MKELSAFEKQFQKEFFYQSNKEFQLRDKDLKEGYWSIFPSPNPKKGSAWANCYYHFEILWENSKSLCQAEKIHVQAHIDQRNKNDKNVNLTNEFEHKLQTDMETLNQKLSEKKENGVLCTESVNADFSDFHSSIDTIKRILDVLHSDPFQECKKIADNYKS